MIALLKRNEERKMSQAIKELEKRMYQLELRAATAETRVNVLEKEVENNMVNIRHLTRELRENVRLWVRVGTEKVDRSEWKINGQP